ncbi:MAG: hypothetical protein ACAH11_12870 [Sphingomonas sp.]
MAIFPKIQSPCPYKANLAAIMDGDMCRMCKRNVVDITHWSDDERVSFLASCETEVCVTYRFPVRPALVAAAMAAAVAALPAAAQDAPAPDVTAQADAPVYEEDPEIMVGGIKDPRNVEMIEDVADAAIPEIPVVYETPAVATKPADPVSGS